MSQQSSMSAPSDFPMSPAPPMSGAPMPIEPLQPPLYPVTSAPGAVAALRATVCVDVASGELDVTEQASAEPPHAALEAVQVASEAFELLRRNGRELHFETGDNGVMRIDVYDGTGELLRSIPPNEALAIASGEATWRA